MYFECYVSGIEYFLDKTYALCLACTFLLLWDARSAKRGIATVYVVCPSVCPSVRACHVNRLWNNLLLSLCQCLPYDEY